MFLTPSLSLKIALLLACGVLNYIGFVPPRMSAHPTVRKSGSPKRTLPYKMWLARVNGVAILGLTLVEAAVILAQSLPRTTLTNTILSSLTPTSTPLPLTLQLTPRFIIGTSISIGGIALRMWSYRTLGRLFTLEVAMQKDHKLVTSGPYSYVRHPSYTGGILMIAGNPIALLSAGSYLQEVGAGQSFLGQVTLSSIVFAWAYFCVVLLPRRAAREDAMLREGFGEEWEAYASRTPCRLCPLVW